MIRTAEPPSRLPGDGPRQVSKFEFNLLRVLRFFLGHFPSDQGLQLLRAAAQLHGPGAARAFCGHTPRQRLLQAAEQHLSDGHRIVSGR